MSCCHYDEGYEAGREEAQADPAIVADALRSIARHWFHYESVADAEALERAADWVLRRGGNWGDLTKRREAEMVRLYREARAA